MIWKKLTLFAATLLFPFAVLHAVGVAEAAFRCDFEWMKQVEYDFLNFEEATGSIVKDDLGDSENSFLRLVNVRPSHYLVLTIQLNMKYRPGQTLRVRHREDTEIPGNDNNAYIFPETAIDALTFVKKGKKYLWWLSVDMPYDRFIDIYSKANNQNEKRQNQLFRSLYSH